MGPQEQRMLQAVEDSLGPAIVEANVLAGELDTAVWTLEWIGERLENMRLRLALQTVFVLDDLYPDD